MSEIAPDAATPSQEAAPVAEAPVAQTPVAEAPLAPQQETPIQSNTPPGGPPPQLETPAEAPVVVPDRVVPTADGYALPEGIPTEFGEVANKLDYTQEQAEGTAQLIGNYMHGISEGEKTSNVDAFNDFVKDMSEDEVGELKADARKGLGYIDEDGVLTEILKTSNGYDFNPVILQGLAKIGKMLKEGNFVKGNVNTPLANDNQSRAHRMYPNDAPK